MLSKSEIHNAVTNIGVGVSSSLICNTNGYSIIDGTTSATITVAKIYNPTKDDTFKGLTIEEINYALKRVYPERFV